MNPNFREIPSIRYSSGGFYGNSRNCYGTDYDTYERGIRQKGRACH